MILPTLACLAVAVGMPKTATVAVLPAVVVVPESHALSGSPPPDLHIQTVDTVAPVETALAKRLQPLTTLLPQATVEAAMAEVRLPRDPGAYRNKSLLQALRVKLGADAVIAPLVSEFEWTHGTAWVRYLVHRPSLKYEEPYAFHTAEVTLIVASAGRNTVLARRGRLDDLQMQDSTAAENAALVVQELIDAIPAAVLPRPMHYGSSLDEDGGSR